MRAVVLGDGGLRLDAAYPDPKPKKGEAIVRVAKAGICGTDLELLRGYKGFRGVPGHEFVGVVERCAEKPELVGECVVGEINVGCGHCELCRRAGTHHCERRDVLGILGRDGAFAERLALPWRNLHVAGREPAAVHVLAEPLAAALHVLDQVAVDDRTRAAVLGPGRLGRLVAVALRSRTPHVDLIGRHDASPRNADLVVDCTGSPDGVVRALEIVRPRGTVVLKSTFAGSATLPAAILARAVVDEIRLVGSRCGSSDDFVAAVNTLIFRPEEFLPFVEATYPLADFATALEHAARPGALHVLLDLT